MNDQPFYKVQVGDHWEIRGPNEFRAGPLSSEAAAQRLVYLFNYWHYTRTLTK